MHYYSNRKMALLFFGTKEGKLVLYFSFLFYFLEYVFILTCVNTKMEDLIQLQIPILLISQIFTLVQIQNLTIVC